VSAVWTRLRQEPFRIFFPLAVLFGAIGVGHWLVFELGWTDSYSGAFHAHVQVWGYIGSFAVGFLMTALPRSGGAPAASSVEVGAAIAAVLGTNLAVATGLWALANVANVCLLGLIVAFAGRRFAKKRSAAPPPLEFVWIPIALLFGTLGSLVAAAARSSLLPATVIKIGEVAAQQGFLIGIVLGVGGFLAPRLMGHSVAISPHRSPADAERARRRRLSLHLLAASLILASFVLEGARAARWAYLLRGATVTAELVWTARIHRWPGVDSLFTQLLWASLWATAAGLLAAGIMPGLRVAMLHVTFIGGFGLMTFAIGTMVVLSHTGAARRLMESLWGLRAIAAGVAIALLARVGADSHIDRYFAWLAAAAVAWFAAAAAWAALSGPRLWRFAAPGEFERAHEEAKAELRHAAERPRRVVPAARREAAGGARADGEPYSERRGPSCAP
jgi:uncharacterized protein involved in response to NO